MKLNQVDNTNMTTFDDYEKTVLEFAVYPGQGTDEGINYTLIALAGEVGELLNKWKKHLRGDREFDRQAALYELGDIQWYIAAAARELDASLEQVAVLNVGKLARRSKEDKIRGEGDYR